MFTVRVSSIVGLLMLGSACGSAKHSQPPPAQNVITDEVSLIDPYSYSCAGTLVDLNMTYTYVLRVNDYGDKEVYGELNLNEGSYSDTVTYTKHQPINYTYEWSVERDANEVSITIDQDTNGKFTFSEKTGELILEYNNKAGSHEFTGYCLRYNG